GSLLRTYARAPHTHYQEYRMPPFSSVVVNSLLNFVPPSRKPDHPSAKFVKSIAPRTSTKPFSRASFKVSAGPSELKTTPVLLVSSSQYLPVTEKFTAVSLLVCTSGPPRPAPRAPRNVSPLLKLVVVPSAVKF